MKRCAVGHTLRVHLGGLYHSGYKCIRIRAVTFPYGDSTIKFDAPIVENFDSPLILANSDIYKLQSRGADKRDNNISFGCGPKLQLVRAMRHILDR